MNLDKEKEYYKKYGYVVLKDYFTNEEANNIVRYADELENWNEVKGKWMIYFEENKQKSRIENFKNYHSEINRLLELKLNPLINAFHNTEMELFKDKLNWKYSGGKGFKPHQDQPAWSDLPPTFYSSVALFANNTTKKNGCLEFAKDQLTLRTILPYNEDTDGKLKDHVVDNLSWETLETTPRDVLIFNSYIPHKSDMNTTNNSRRIFYFTYNYKKEGNYYDMYLEKKREYFPPDIERDNTKKIPLDANKYNLANPIK